MFHQARKLSPKNVSLTILCDNFLSQAQLGLSER